MSDIAAAIGGMFSGVGNAFSSGMESLGSGIDSMTGGTVGNFMESLGSGIDSMTGGTVGNFLGGAGPSSADPSLAAQTTISPPSQGTAQQQVDASGGTQSDPSQPDQPVRGPNQRAVATDSDAASVAGRNAIRDLIRQLTRQAAPRPYQTGAGEASPSEVWENEGGASGTPTPKPGFRIEPAPGQRFLPKWEEGGEMDIPGRFSPGKGFGPDTDIGTARNPRAVAAGEGAVGEALAPPDVAPGLSETVFGAKGQPINIGPSGWPSGTETWAEGPSAEAGGPSLGGLAAALARMMGVSNPLIPGLAMALKPTPTAMDEAPTNAWNQRPSGVPDPEAEQPTPGAEAAATSGTNAPDVRGKDITVHKDGSKTQKKLNPDGSTTTTKTTPPKHGKDDRYWLDDQGQKHWITKDGQPLPTKKPPQTGAHPPGQSQIMRDAAGMGMFPQMLGQLAQIALPMILSGMMGGGRRGFGPHRFGGGRFGFHPQYRFDPRFSGGMGGPALPFAGNRPMGGQGPAPGGYADPPQGPWSGNQWDSVMVGAESSGRNSGSGRPEDGPAGDDGESYGYFNIKTPTWNEYRNRVPDAAQYDRADKAPYEIQKQVAALMPISIFGDRTRNILHRKFGDFDEGQTVGDLSAKYGGATQTAKPATTPTGDKKEPLEARGGMTASAGPDLTAVQMAQAELARSQQRRLRQPTPAEHQRLQNLMKQYQDETEPREDVPTFGPAFGAKSMMA